MYVHKTVKTWTGKTSNYSNRSYVSGGKIMDYGGEHRFGLVLLKHKGED